MKGNIIIDNQNLLGFLIHGLIFQIHLIKSMP